MVVVAMTTVASIFIFFPFSLSGPRLYKEPSAKSNKHIIQNALAHCCLAGKVNQAQKNKILEVTTTFHFGMWDILGACDISV